MSMANRWAVIVAASGGIVSFLFSIIVFMFAI
jgi:hypothetical protein